jgi:hypothetical protein
MGYGDPMPTRSRARRNPDPPQTLRQFRADAFREALKRRGIPLLDALTWMPERTLRGVVGGHRVTLTLNTENLWWLEVEYAYETDNRTDMAEYGTARVLPQVSEVAEELGEIFACATSMPPPTPVLIQPSEEYITHVFVPSYTKRAPSVAKAVLAALFERRGSEKSAKACATLAKALSEMRARSVPRTYRKQVAELFRHAFENNDLGEYEHAAYLASMVSE